jgi:hypothetical protein
MWRRPEVGLGMVERELAGYAWTHLLDLIHGDERCSVCRREVCLV